LRGIDAKGTTISISADGAITAKGKNPNSVNKLLKNLVLEVFRSEECTGCETCLVHCSSEAISIQPTTNQTEIEVSLCTQCRECHNRCPVIKFGHREIDELFS
jgi:ferredoxin